MRSEKVFSFFKKMSETGGIIPGCRDPADAFPERFELCRDRKPQEMQAGGSNCPEGLSVHYSDFMLVEGEHLEKGGRGGRLFEPAGKTFVSIDNPQSFAKTGDIGEQVKSPAGFLARNSVNGV